MDMNDDLVKWGRAVTFEEWDDDPVGCQERTVAMADRIEILEAGFLLLKKQVDSASAGVEDVARVCDGRIKALEQALAGETLAADSLFEKYRKAKSDLFKARREALEEASKAADALLSIYGLFEIADDVAITIRALKEKE